MTTDCPICLDHMTDADRQHPLRCPTKCGYNFCSSCVKHLINSSQSGYEEASDGSRQVKVQLICPQCRSDLSYTIEDTLHQRMVAEASKFQNQHDDELTAKQLRLKYSYSLDGGAGDPAKTGDATSPPGLLAANSGSFADDDSASVTMTIDPALFGGLEFAMTDAEQQYVTELMASGDVDRVAQATQILSSIGDMSRKGITPSMRTASASGGRAAHHHPATSRMSGGGSYARSRVDSRGRTAASRGLRSGYSGSVAVGRALKMSRTTVERKRDAAEARIEAHRKKHPLPVRMPRYVTLDMTKSVDPASKKFPLAFADDEWDGSIADAFSRVHIGRNNKVLRTKKNREEPLLKSSSSGDSSEDYGPQPRIIVANSKGAASKLGIQKGDVVTHLNGDRFEGNADDLLNAIRDVCFVRGASSFSLVLNAELATAEAIRRRALVTD